MCHFHTYFYKILYYPYSTKILLSLYMYPKSTYSIALQVLKFYINGIILNVSTTLKKRYVCFWYLSTLVRIALNFSFRWTYKYVFIHFPVNIYVASFKKTFFAIKNATIFLYLLVYMWKILARAEIWGHMDAHFQFYTDVSICFSQWL